ncbi:sensor domain-containing protein [Haloarchaeobius iranensis]|uniref:Putative sensor n=1 Tax=Haloarchaeobius iranensis TaxID=996166 RepID=A0A1H0A169_9EURY|nr:sensor domain-containing protein [Haloarchaeobius iranensis]SDN27459.1 Putative sensor [Haloarchaeobius iranensis]
MRAHTTGRTSSSLLGRIFGVAVDRQTYRNALYLLLRFPLGIVYLTVFVTLLSVGVSLVPLLVGVPILAGVLAVAGYVGVIEAALLRTLVGREAAWTPTSPNDTPIVPYLKQVATEPHNYLFLILAFVSFVTGNTLFVALVVWFALSLSFVIAPAVYRVEGVQYFNVAGPVDLGIVTVTESQLIVDTLPEALLVSLVGIVSTVIGLHLVNLTTRVYADITAAVLSTSE